MSPRSMPSPLPTPHPQPIRIALLAALAIALVVVAGASASGSSKVVAKEAQNESLEATVLTRTNGHTSTASASRPTADSSALGAVSAPGSRWSWRRE